MSTNNFENLVRDAEQFYEERLRTRLEETHPNEFVAVEPESEDFFLGKSLSEAVGAARDAHPDRLSHVLRIGHKAALHFGIHLQ